MSIYQLIRCSWCITSLLICCRLSCSNVVGSGCGSVAMLVEEGKFDTANYPGLYPSSTKCHWLIEAPVDRVIKVIRSNDPGWNATNLFLGCQSKSFLDWHPVTSHKSFLRQRILLIGVLTALKMASPESIVIGRVRQLPRADDFRGQEREIDYDLI